MSWRAEIHTELAQFALDVRIDGPCGPIAVIGPNGSGKTTLLRILAGAERPERGEIAIGDEVVFSSERAIDQACEERRVGYVPQGLGLFPHLRVIDNVAFGLSTGKKRQSLAKRHAEARALLDELGVGHLADREPHRLSGGEQQRVALARALVIAPRLLLLDEPLAALDATARRGVRRFLADRLQALGRPSLLVTHDVRDVMALDAEVCVLERGRVVQRGDLEALRRDPASDFVAEFVAI
ncbi:MAG: ABC transporter ATP-binding protein [Myxococcales bacterium]|nr:ABC transporter ATP-binding protein [Myxococcales bacterium]